MKKPIDINPTTLGIVVLAIGALIPLVIWGIWYWATGYIPKFFGVSRIWWDSVAGAFYIFIIIFCVVSVLDAYDEISCEWKVKIPLRKFVSANQRLSFFCAFLFFVSVASIFLTIAFGLISGILALIAVEIKKPAAYSYFQTP